MMLRTCLILGVLVSVSAWAGWTQKGTAEVAFSGKGPGGFKLEGKTSSLTVKDDGKTLTLVVPLKDLKTGIEMRDNHMKNKYLEVEKYPDAKLEVPLDSIKAPGEGETVKASAKGTFSMHGKSKELPFNYESTCKGGSCTVNGTLKVNFFDFGVEKPGYMGITVQPDIDVKTSFTVNKG